MKNAISSILFLLLGSVAACGFFIGVAKLNNFVEPIPTRVLNLWQPTMPRNEKSVDDALWYCKFKPFIPLPDNVEDILIEQEFWKRYCCAGVYVKGGELCFRHDVEIGGENSFCILQFHSDSEEITWYFGDTMTGKLHVESINNKSIYADRITVVAYDGENMLITKDQIVGYDTWWRAYFEKPKSLEEWNYNVAFVERLTPLSPQERDKLRSQIYGQGNASCR